MALPGILLIDSGTIHMLGHSEHSFFLFFFNRPFISGIKKRQKTGATTHRDEPRQTSKSPPKGADAPQGLPGKNRVGGGD